MNKLLIEAVNGIFYHSQAKSTSLMLIVFCCNSKCLPIYNANIDVHAKAFDAVHLNVTRRVSPLGVRGILGVGVIGWAELIAELICDTVLNG